MEIKAYDLEPEGESKLLNMPLDLVINMTRFKMRQHGGKYGGWLIRRMNTMQGERIYTPLRIAMRKLRSKLIRTPIGNYLTITAVQDGFRIKITAVLRNDLNGG